MTDKLKKMLIGVAALAALALGGSALAGAASGGNGAATQERTQAADTANSATDPDDVQDENGKDDATEASEQGEEETDQPVTGEAAARAREAAAAETGGKAGDVERDTEKGAIYEVEVTKPDGTQADVRLDDQFKVVAVDEDTEQDETGEQNEIGEQDDASGQGANAR